MSDRARQRARRSPRAARSQLRGVEVGAALVGRELCLPEDLIDPRATDAGDRALVAQERVQGSRRVEHRAERRRVGPRFGAERGERLVLLERIRAQQLDPGGLLGAELAQAQLASVARSARAAARCGRAGPRACHTAATGRPTSGGSAAPASIRMIPSTLTIRCLPRRRPPAPCRPSSAASGGSNVFSALMPGASADSISRPAQRRVQQPRGDLDLGQLRHRLPIVGRRPLDDWRGALASDAVVSDRGRRAPAWRLSALIDRDSASPMSTAACQ